MSPGAKTEAMKQQPLPFTTRRSATANAKGKGIKSPATEPSTPASVAVKAEDVQEPVLPADDEVTPKTSVKRRSQRRKPQDAEVEATSSKKRKLQEVDESPSSKAKGKGNGKADRVKRVFKSRVSVENTEDGQASPRRDADSSDVDSPADLDTSEKAKKQRLLRHYAEVRTKMGHLEPIHAKGQTKEYHILRVFDLSYEYGPCIGMSRLQRWERADALGLSPPLAVKEILLAEQAKEGSTMTECVFEGEV